MIHNSGNQMRVVSFLRLDKVALEPPPNDGDFSPSLPQMLSGLGGRTAPSCAGGMIPPQSADGAVVVNTRAPECRQDYTQDGGTITATPAVSQRRQEAQKGVAVVVGEVGDWSTLQVFQK